MAVEMCIDPEQTGRLAEMTREAAPGADGDRVIAADDHRKTVVGQRHGHFVGEMAAEFGNALHRRLAAARRWRVQRPPPVEQRMPGQFMPGLRMMKSDRPVLAGLVLGTQTAGRAGDADTGAGLVANLAHVSIAGKRRESGLPEFFQRLQGVAPGQLTNQPAFGEHRIAVEMIGNEQFDGIGHR